MRNPVTTDLFESVRTAPSQETMAEGAVLLREYARPFELELMRALSGILAQAPFRRMLTPGGHQMSVAMTNCGSYGWVTDRTGAWARMPLSARISSSSNGLAYSRSSTAPSAMV